MWLINNTCLLVLVLSLQEHQGSPITAESLKPAQKENSSQPNGQEEYLVPKQPSVDVGLQCLEKRNQCESLCGSFDPQTLKCNKRVQQCQDICIRFGRKMLHEEPLDNNLP